MNQIMHTPATASIEAVIASKRGINEMNESDNETDEFLMGPSAGIVFGRERSGLTNEEVALADSTICIPSYDNYPVLNLAQAVNIIGYEMFKRQKELTEDVKQGGTLSLRTTDRLANRGELDMFLERLENNLDSRGYQSVSKNNNRDSDKDNSDRLNQGDESKESAIEREGAAVKRVGNEDSGVGYHKETKFRTIQAIFRRVRIFEY